MPTNPCSRAFPMVLLAWVALAMACSGAEDNAAPEAAYDDDFAETSPLPPVAAVPPSESPLVLLRQDAARRLGMARDEALVKAIQVPTAGAVVDPQVEAAGRVLNDPIEYAARHCYIDRFANDIYKREYFEALGVVAVGDESTPLPATPPRITPDDPGYEAYVAGLKHDWLAAPASHVLDCELTLEERECEQCEHRARRSFRYGIYLPARYFTDPGSVKTVLLLAPGGKGGRVRWFLEPVPYKVNKKHLSQGLSLQRKLDEHLAANPELEHPIVITVDDPGQGYTNGIYEYLTEDIPTHVLGTWLQGRSRDQVAYGIDAISSGSRNAAAAFIYKPEAFDTFGWMCTHCAADGFDPERFFGWPQAPGHKAIQRWAERAQAGDLHMKFSIGKKDRYIGCNREMHARLMEAGVIEDTHAPYLRDCAEGLDPNGNLTREQAQECVTVKPSMTEYPNIGHSYALMPAAFDEHVYWHVARLTDVARLRGL